MPLIEQTTSTPRPRQGRGPSLPDRPNEVRPRKNHRSFDLISEASRDGWIATKLGTTGDQSLFVSAMHRSRSHDALIRVYGEAGNMIEAHEDAGEFKEP